METNNKSNIPAIINNLQSKQHVSYNISQSIVIPSKKDEINQRISQITEEIQNFKN